jgi:hypothetical protein
MGSSDPWEELGRAGERERIKRAIQIDMNSVELCTDMTFLVRQLPPAADGLPIEI